MGASKCTRKRLYETVKETLSIWRRCIGFQVFSDRLAFPFRWGAGWCVTKIDCVADTACVSVLTLPNTST